MNGLRRLRRSQPFQVFLIGMAGLGLGAILSAASLLESAKHKPFGDDRDAWVAVWEPFDAVGRWTFLDGPGNWIADVRANDPATLPPITPVSATATPTPTELPTATPRVAESATLSPDVTPSPTATVAPSPTPLPLLRTPSEADPLRMWVGGDSQAGTLTSSLAKLAGETGYFETTTEFRVSSGLTRPDFFDWPAFLFQESETRDLEVVVLMLGGNDSQGIQTADGDVFARLTDGWRDEYRMRVSSVMDLLTAPGRILVWVGQPIMRDGGYSERMADLNAIYESEAGTRPWVLFLDTFEMFQDGDAGYSPYLPDAAGELTLVRQSDGIHLTRAGGDVLAAAILTLIRAEAGLLPD